MRERQKAQAFPHSLSCFLDTQKSILSIVEKLLELGYEEVDAKEGARAPGAEISSKLTNRGK